MNYLIAAVVLILISIGASVLLFGCLIVAGRADRWEQQADEDPDDPCEECLRWSECNGVDPSCPLRKEDTDGKIRS